MIYAIDFDGTLCTDKFPSIGEEIPARVETVKQLKKMGHKIILWTSRKNDSHGNHLDAAIEWCKERGLTFDAVNENLPEIQSQWGGDTRKVFCDFYIDDKNLPAVYLDKPSIKF